MSPGFRRALLSVSNACCRPARLRASLLRFQPERSPLATHDPATGASRFPGDYKVLITGCIMTHVHRSERKPTAAPEPASGACRCPGKAQCVSCKPSLCFRTEFAGLKTLQQWCNSLAPMDSTTGTRSFLRESTKSGGYCAIEASSRLLARAGAGNDHENVLSSRRKQICKWQGQASMCML